MSEDKDAVAGRPTPDRSSGGVAPRGKARVRARGAGDGGEQRSRNPFAVIVRFIREVVAEMRKVIWPDKRDMITYTIVVVVFIVGLVAFTTGLDLGFGKLVDLVFG